jgi:hypothetical protein
MASTTTARAELPPASHAPSQGINEKVTTKVAALLTFVQCQPGQQHDRHPTRHSAS